MKRFAHVFAFLFFLGLVAGKYDNRTGFSSLIRFSESWKGKQLGALRNLPIATTVPESGGYDGQFYAQIALDPLLRDPHLAEAMDIPAYRARRILVPATAALLGAGNVWWTLQIYSLINVACWIALAWLLRTGTRDDDWISFARWSGVMFSTGVLESVRQSLVDLPALLLLVVSVRAYMQSKPNRSTPWLALGNLAKETTFLGTVALNADGFFRRETRIAAVVRLILASIPLGVWCLYVAHRFPQDPANGGFGNFSWPFSGLFSELRTCMNALARGDFDGRFSFGLLAIIGLVTQSIVLGLRRNTQSPWWRVGMAYALLLPFLGTWVWSGYWAACRALLPLTVAFNLSLPANRAFWPTWTVGNLTLLHAVWRFL